MIAPKLPGRNLTPLDLARRVVERVTARGATNVALLDLRGLTVIADHFVLCTVGSTPQMRALRESMEEELAKEIGRTLRFEGEFSEGWMLVDFGDVILHVFSEDGRANYRLDQLWSDAPVLLRVQ